MFGRINEFECMNRGDCTPSLTPLMSVYLCVCKGVTLKHNGAALELIQQLWVSQDHTMMPVVPLASPLSGTTVDVHKFEKEKSPACGPSQVWVGPLNTPARFSTLVHASTGGTTGGKSTLQRGAKGSPNCPEKG